MKIQRRKIAKKNLIDIQEFPKQNIFPQFQQVPKIFFEERRKFCRKKFCFLNFEENRNFEEFEKY